MQSDELGKARTMGSGCLLRLQAQFELNRIRFSGKAEPSACKMEGTEGRFRARLSV